MKKSTIQILSFVSGLTLAAVVVGVTISKSPGIRAEIEKQANSVLKTTRSLVDAYKSIAGKSKSAASLISNDAGDKSAKETSGPSVEQARADSQWDAVEAKLEK